MLRSGLISFIHVLGEIANGLIAAASGAYLTIRPVARKGYGSIAHEAKPNGLLTRGP